MKITQRLSMATFQSLRKKLLDHGPLIPTLYDGNPVSIDDAKTNMQRFGGGSVDLEMRSNGIAIVTLNQPSKRNAISGKMMANFHDVVGELEKWETGKGVILRGFDGNFCSGGDLAVAQEGNPSLGYQMSTLMDNVLSRFQLLPLLTVAVIQGCGALGGGAEISVACDFRLMSEKCQGIGFVHGRLAVLPAWGGTGRLVRTVGYRKALQLISTAKVYRPAEAERLELIDEVIPCECDDIEYTLGWLQQRTSGSCQLIHAQKTTALLAANNFNEGDYSELERRIFASFWGCPDNKIALSKAIKHRP